MKITAEILYWLYQRRNPSHPVSEHIGTPGLALDHVAMYRPGEKIRQDVLYILQTEHLSVWNKELPDSPVGFLLCGSGPHSARPEDNCARFTETAGGEPDSTVLLEELTQYWICLNSWESRLLGPILRQEPGEGALPLGEELFPRGYALIDPDMYVLYSSPVFWSDIDPDREPGYSADRLSEEAVRELMIHREFHAAARETRAFYYYDDPLDLTAICRNILLEDRYCARLVMYLGPGETSVPSGMEELFELFADHIRDMFRFGNLKVRRNPRDPLHLICQALFDGDRPEESMLQSVLKAFSWECRHDYAVLNIQFFMESGWDTQWETTLPFLCGELERRWPASCAIPAGSDIRWVINLSLSSILEDLRHFRQQLAYFLRDNICRAGVSPRFSDFRLLPYALRAADDALRIGRSRQPHFWYYVFDDYRLTYMMENIQRDLPVSMLCHPAVHQLMQYDEEHQTDLSLTLKAYLEHGLNMTAASEAVYIHRTTFCRRMDRIREITGLKLEDSRTILELQISYRLF